MNDSAQNVTIASRSPDRSCTRPGDQTAALTTTSGITLSRIPPVAQTAPDASQVRRVDALLENVWPQVEEEGLNRTCLSKLFDDGDIPLEPCPRGAVPERCTGGMDQLPQRCPGAKGDIRDLARETPVTPVTSKKAMSGPPCELKQGQTRLNEAESLQRCAVLQQSDASRITVPAVQETPVNRMAPRHLLATASGNSKESSHGAPCTNSPCKSALPTESVENASRRKDELVNAGTTQAIPKASEAQGQGGDVLLVVHYREGEQPMSEILRLEGGQGSPVTVESVAVGSKAARAGVAPGYALVTMNGRNEFMQLPGWQVRLLLEAPITLGFDPAPRPSRSQVGMCTEIRLKRVQETIGVPPKVAVCGPRDYGMLAEEVVFKPGSAPLFIKSSKSASDPSTISLGDMSQPYIYELRHTDAQGLVGRAVHGARALVESTLEVECVVDPGAHSYSWRAISPTSSCSLVAECVSGEEDATKTNTNLHPPVPRQFVFHKSSNHGNTSLLEQQPVWMPARGSSPKTSPRDPKRIVQKAEHLEIAASSGIGGIAKVPELRTRNWRNSYEADQASPRSSVETGATCGCGYGDDEDDWLNFQSPRSPLRWLAPVLEPVMRAFSPSRSPSRTMPPKPENSPRSSPRSRNSATQNIFAGMTPANTVSPPCHVPARRGRDETVTPIFRDVLRQNGRENGFSGAVRQPSPNQGMQPARASPISSRTPDLGGPVHNVHSLSGPRSRSPQQRVPVGDTSPAGDSSIDVFDNVEPGSTEALVGFQEFREWSREHRHVDVRMPASPPQAQEPSFSVSWKDDMLASDKQEETATLFVKGRVSSPLGPRQGTL